MPKTAEKLFNIQLVYIGYPKKEDLLLTDKAYTSSECLKIGDALAKEHGYSTFRIVEAKKKRTRKAPVKK